MGVLFSKIPPVRDSENVASWENCFPRCPLLRKRGILGVLFPKMPPVQKTWHLGSTVSQDAPCLNRGHLGKQHSQDATFSKFILENMPSSNKEQNQQNWGIMGNFKAQDVARVAKNRGKRNVSNKKAEASFRRRGQTSRPSATFRSRTVRLLFPIKNHFGYQIRKPL